MVSQTEILSTGVESLGIQSFNASGYAPTNLETDSSSVSRTAEGDTQEMLNSIREKRNTLQIIRANLALSSDLVKAAIDYRKLEGLGIDYEAVLVDNQTKLVRKETANLHLTRERVAMDGVNHLVDQERIKTDGIDSLTPLVKEEWEMRKEVARAKIDDLRRSVEKLKSTFIETRNTLESA